MPRPVKSVKRPGWTQSSSMWSAFGTNTTLCSDAQTSTLCAGCGLLLRQPPSTLTRPKFKPADGCRFQNTFQCAVGDR